MKKVLVLALTMAMTLFGAYQVGDQVQNYTWEDSESGSTGTVRNMDEIINSGKLVIVTWGYKGCGYCKLEAPVLDQFYKDPEFAGKLHIIFASTNDNSWASLNGSGWRTFINPPITYMVSTASQFGSSTYTTAFGVSGVPHLVMIGKNRILKSVHVGFAASMTAPMRAEIAELLKDFDFCTENPVADQAINPLESKIIDLSSVFFSSHGTPTIELVENSDPDKATAVLNGTQLTITAKNGFGFTNIKIKGTAGEYSSTDNFTVQVVDQNATTLSEEGFEGTWPPTNWTNQGWQISTKLHHTGLKSAGAIYTHTGSVNLTSPTLNIPFGGLLEFWWRDDDITKIVGTDSTFCEISTDGGSSWTTAAVLSAESSESVFSKVMIDLNSYAGSNTKVRFRDWSDGSGNAWGSAVDDVKITAYSSVAINNDLAAKDFVLKQNYPNPFNPTTTIDFTLKSEIEVSLTVYNQTGAEVAVIAAGKMSQGEHSVMFDASKFNSGVYYDTLKAGNQEKTGKMLLIK